MATECADFHCQHNGGEFTHANRPSREECIHPGVFAGSDNTPVHCHSCGRDVPVEEL